MSLSHFDEKRGVIACTTEWGRWWQTVGEVCIEVNLPNGTRAKQVAVNIKPKCIECIVKGETIFKGTFFRTVVADETIWTIEEQKLLQIQLAKADPINLERPWHSLLEGQFAPDPMTFHEMQKQLDLEKFQIENPGFDFSNATLQKNYDSILPQPFSKDT